MYLFNEGGLCGGFGSRIQFGDSEMRTAKHSVIERAYKYMSYWAIKGKDSPGQISWLDS